MKITGIASKPTEPRTIKWTDKSTGQDRTAEVLETTVLDDTVGETFRCTDWNKDGPRYEKGQSVERDVKDVRAFGNPATITLTLT